MKRLKNKKGFTLVEVVVAMVITTIIIVAVANLFSPAMQIISSVRNDVNYDTACNAVNTYVRNSIDSSAQVKIVALSDASSAVSAMQADANYPASDYKLKALAVIGGKLYDFGTNVSSITASSTYSAFQDAFYGVNSLTAGIEVEASGKWVKLQTQAFDVEGNIINQPRTVTFKVFGGNVFADAVYSNDYAIIYYQYNII